jgi:hypothetical protein
MTIVLQRTGGAVTQGAPQLAALLRQCCAAGIARRALLLRLSALPEGRARPHHLRLAQDALLPLAAADRAQMFRLANADLAMVWRGETAALETCLRTLRHLFEDDLAPGPGALAVVLDLPAQADTLARAMAEGPPGPASPPPRPRATTPLDPATLQALEGAMAQADMTRFSRRQPVVQATPSGNRLAWERRFIDDTELFETMLPDRAPRAEPWLFRRLCATLDRRMLALLARPEELRDAVPFSLDLGVASLTSAGFLRFDAALPAGLRGKVLLNLRPDDILTDPAGFVFARDFARGRGYPLVLHDLPASQIGLMPVRRLGLDLVQLRWSAELARTADLPDPAMVVLGGADDPACIAWGRQHGIARYQGRMALPDAARGA